MTVHRTTHTTFYYCPHFPSTSVNIVGSELPISMLTLPPFKPHTHTQHAQHKHPPPHSHRCVGGMWSSGGLGYHMCRWGVCVTEKTACGTFEWICDMGELSVLKIECKGWLVVAIYSISTMLHVSTFNSKTSALRIRNVCYLSKIYCWHSVDVTYLVQSLHSFAPLRLVREKVQLDGWPYRAPPVSCRAHREGAGVIYIREAQRTRMV